MMTMPSSQLHHHDLREVDGEASSIFRTVSELASTQCILNRRYCFLQRGAGRIKHLRALAALERLIFYELMNNLLIFGTAFESRCLFFQILYFGPSPRHAFVALTTSSLLGAPRYFHGIEDDRGGLWKLLEAEEPTSIVGT